MSMPISMSMGMSMYMCVHSLAMQIIRCLLSSPHMLSA